MRTMAGDLVEPELRRHKAVYVLMVALGTE